MIQDPESRASQASQASLSEALFAEALFAEALFAVDSAIEPPTHYEPLPERSSEPGPFSHVASVR